MPRTAKPKNRIELNIHGKTVGFVPVTEFTAKKTGNPWYGVARPGSKSETDPNGLPANARWGLNVTNDLLGLPGGTEDEPFAGLPTSCTLFINGKEIVEAEFEPGFTGTDRPKHTASEIVNIPGMGSKRFTMRISDLHDGRNNLAVAIHAGSSTVTEWEE